MININENIVQYAAQDIMFSRRQKDGTYFEVKCGESGTTLTSSITEANSSKGILTGSANPATAITIGNCVTAIADNAFSGWKYVTGTLTLPEGIKTIGEGAFSGCSGLSGELIIPESVTDIEEYAFVLCDGLTSIIVKSARPFKVGGKSFPYENNNSPIYVPDESLYEYKAAFGWDAYSDRIRPMSSQYGSTKCKYQKLSRQVLNYLTGQWESTGEYKLGDIIEYDSPDCDTINTRWITATTEYICDDCEDDPSDTIMYSRTQKDGTYFEVKCGDSGTSLTSAITTSESSREVLIGETNPATSITIGNCVTEIGDEAFNYWKHLTGNLVIPGTVTSIGEWAFGVCSGFTGTLTIPDSVRTIGRGAFYWCLGLNGTLTLPNNLTSIGAGAFLNCTGFTGHLVIPDSVTEIGTDTFYGCEGFDGTLTLGKYIKTIGESAFSGCKNLTGDLIIPDSVTSISRNAFYDCRGFYSIKLGSNLKTIGEHAFSNNSGLNFAGSLTIPASVTSIADGAFFSCFKLSSIIIERTTPPTLGVNVFYSDREIPIYVPDASLNAYKNAMNWSTYSSRIKPLSEKT